MITEAIQQIQHNLPEGVCLVAVSKYHTADDIMKAYRAGQRDFGENHVQELVQKHAMLPDDIRWHFIGHLQTNKVKLLVPFVYLVQSVDSARLLECLERHASEAGRRVSCLLQIHIAREETKFGFAPDECRALLQGDWRQQFPHIDVQGLMGMATNTADTAQVAAEFEGLHALFMELKNNCFDQDPGFRYLSMGMTHDYPVALQHGANIIRIGTGIFGPRQYKQ